LKPGFHTSDDAPLWFAVWNVLHNLACAQCRS
jgi:hypothetical protein